MFTLQVHIHCFILTKMQKTIANENTFDKHKYKIIFISLPTHTYIQAFAYMLYTHTLSLSHTHTHTHTYIHTYIDISIKKHYLSFKKKLNISSNQLNQD